MSLSLDQALEMAEQALEDGELEDARVLADQALAQAPDDLDALEIKGLALGELGEFEDADEVFERLLTLDPKHTTGLIAAADVKIRQPGDDRERIEEGLLLLERAEPRAKRDEALSIEMDLLRGIAFNQLGDFEDALDAFARVLHLDPDHGEAQLEGQGAHLGLGQAAEGEARAKFLATPKALAIRNRWCAQQQAAAADERQEQLGDHQQRQPWTRQATLCDAIRYGPDQ